MSDPNNAPGDGCTRPHAYLPQTAWVRRNPVAKKAHDQVNIAKRNGTLTPQPCEWPGCTETRVDAHHPSYAEPLKVVWLCRRHHKAEHRRIECEAMS